MSDCSDEEEFEYEYDYEDEMDSMHDDDGSAQQSEDDVKMNATSSDNADDTSTPGKSSRKHSNLNTSHGSINSVKDADLLIKMTSAKDLVPQMWSRINGITEVLDIPSSAAIVLLRQHRWEKERLFDAFYTDPEKAKGSAGVVARCKVVPASSSAVHGMNVGTTTRPNTRSSAKSNLETCEICYDDFSSEQMYSMPCGHDFCYGCWGDYIDNVIGDGPTCIRSTCPLAGCNETVTEEEVENIAPQSLDLFKSYQLRSYVELSGTSRWCPGPGCERIATINSASDLSWVDDSATGVVAKCDSCTTSFCVKCGEEPHAPLTCRVLSKWIQKCENESETANWILANTKPCPMCSTRIEKNQGCNHMTCQKCRHEFCWICMGKWEDHGANTGGYYKCNKFDDQSNDDQSDVAKAKRELDRYLHYYKRYHAHSEAQKFAKKQLKETETRMVLLQESTENATWTDVEFLKVANEQLVECRRVLKYTYCFAYYMPLPTTGKDSSAYDTTEQMKQMQKDRFEHHQEMLERFTENLSELAEKPLQNIDRVSVVNQTRVVDRFMKNILQYVEDGMDES